MTPEPGDINDIEIYPGNNFFAIRHGWNNSKLEVWNWNGLMWENTLNDDDLAGGGGNWEDSIQVSCGNNFIAVVGGDFNRELTIYNYSGYYWARDPIYNKKALNTSYIDIHPKAYGDYLTVKAGGFAGKNCCYSKARKSWVQTFLKITKVEY